ncbi:hypothetical protein Mpal_2285 [Methanosphaerula palustris E1-9c]|uniref:Uncharacterized protein n=1 Tax=Methanosphaerula palustris (strain ATCC BAA-1556 / DSM 19958 / E1-9c) TaxID=521011 RepID=B8GE70_METPE|nr:hypothetical protein Mpal_2285 [Methanosphaerula palustris E1-9c]
MRAGVVLNTGPDGSVQRMTMTLWIDNPHNATYTWAM